MAFPPSFLDQIRSQVSLVSVIGRRVRLVKKGREHSGLCPFHNEKSPSFTVNEDKGFYHCFGCGAHGDVIAFVMQSHHLSFPEAVERLAQEAGIEVPAQAPEDRERAKRAASLFDVVERACLFFERQLREPAGAAGLDYLRRRGLDDQTIARFRLGYAPDSRTALKSALQQASLPEPLAIEAGLLIVPDASEGRPEGRGRDSYDRFRGRVMFPITDRRGRVIAFGGRILGDGQPKYLNSPDTPLFHKGSILYGLAQAREPAQKAGTVIVCEGYMDVIALSRAGFAHAVAPLGTALTEGQMELLWQMVAEPIVCLDGDAAGQRAAARAAERALAILKAGHSLRFATVPAPEDPDSLIKSRGPAAMREVLDQALPMVEMLWRNKFALYPLETPEQRQGAEQAIRDYFAPITDKGLRDDYVFDLIGRTRATARAKRWKPAAPQGRSEGWGRQVKARTRRYTARDASGRVLVGDRPNQVLPPAWQTQEQLLLLLVIRHPPLLEEVAEKLGNLGFADSTLDKLRQEVLKHLDGWGSLDSEGVQRHLRSCGFSQMLDCLLEARAHDQSAYIRPDAPVEAARRLWEHIFKLYTQRELTAELQQAEQEAAADLSDETFGYLNALWSSKTQGNDR